MNVSTGLASLDRVLRGLMPGDNIVWQVDSIADYAAYVQPYAETAIKNGHKLVYFRFASHEPILQAGLNSEIHQLEPSAGFETFIASIHSVIEKSGPGTHYIFDCLSELAADWYSDQMLGNFFMLTCPYLFDLQTITYFALLRNYHSSHAITPISETTQLFLDIFRYDGRLFMRPVKVQHRYSPTMHLMHEWTGNDFKPVSSSAVISKILTTSNDTGLAADPSAGSWERAFLRAEEIALPETSKKYPLDRQWQLFRQLVRMIISRDDGILRLVSRHLSLEDILNVRRRMIGSGLIGGKATGMLLSRKILETSDPRFADIMEIHDSFYVGSDVFYTFLVRNGIWWVRQKQRNPATFLDGSEQARQLILTGKFPDYIIRKFEEMLDYFGQSPIIVRSSSLLEDNFGNSFAGKYESIFCANQGPREKRLENFIAAVRMIYASSMSREALSYRERHNLLDRDEQMALLVMRVSGAMYSRYYFPQVAGVGFSYNPYVWNENIDPNAGVLRLVFGLGTRAVNRSDDDYTRIVALNSPSRRPESSFEKISRYSQHRMDCIDLDANQPISASFDEIIRKCPEIPAHIFVSEDNSEQARGRNGTRRPAPVLTFDTLLTETLFVDDMRRILATLSNAYQYPVDIEFTVNFLDNENYRINLLQCRPLQVQGSTDTKIPEIKAADDDILIQAHAAVVGQSRIVDIDYFVYVVPEKYGALPINERYAVAHAIGTINHLLGLKKNNIMLIGPGRWGTSTPSLGIPVTFSDINRVSVLCEIVMMREDLVPDVSLGTHFLNELVELNMLYLAVFPKQGIQMFRSEFFETETSVLHDLLPSDDKMPDIIKVIRVSGSGSAHKKIRLAADAMNQNVVCYRNKT